MRLQAFRLYIRREELGSAEAGCSGYGSEEGCRSGCGLVCSGQAWVLPDLRQEELLRCGAQQVILNCGRQWGKSTIAAIKAVHRAHSFAKSLVVVASPTDRQSAEFLKKARDFVKALGMGARGDGH